MNQSSSVLLFVFIALQSILIGLFFVANRRNSMWNAIIILLLFILSSFYFEIKKGAQIPFYVKGMVILSFILHGFIGDYFNWYLKSNWFDKGLHMFSSYGFIFYFYSILNKTASPFSLSKGSKFIFILALGALIGVSFEFIEFFMDLLFDTNHQHGLLDTNLDLLFGMAGSVLAGITGISLNQLEN